MDKDNHIVDGSLNILIKLLGLMLMVAVAIIFASNLGPDLFGLYSFVLSLIAIISIPVHSGLPNLLLREVAKSDHIKDKTDVVKIINWANNIIIRTSVIIIIFSIVIYLLYKDENIWIYIVSTLLIPIVAISKVRASVLRGIGRGKTSMIPEQLIMPIMIIILVVIHFLLRGEKQFSIENAIYIHIAGATTAMICGTYYLKRYLRYSIPAQVKANSYSTQDDKHKAWRSALLPLALLSSVTIVNKNVDILMLGWLLNKYDVGLYAISMQAIIAITFIINALNLYFAPFYSKFYSMNNKDDLQKIVRSSSKIVFIICLPIIITIMIAAEDLLVFILGMEYYDSLIPLYILLIAQFFNILFGPVEMLLTMSGYEKYVVKGVVLSIVLNLCLNLYLIPLMGISGAAISTSIALIIKKLYLIIVIEKTMEIKTGVIRI